MTEKKIENLVEEVEETEVEKEVQTREVDMTKMIVSSKFVVQNSKYGTRVTLKVKLFNGEEIDFSDKNGVYDVLNSYKKIGATNYIKSRKLVKVETLDEEGNVTKRYIAIRYIFQDENGENICLLFPSKFASNVCLENYYRKFCETNK